LALATDRRWGDIEAIRPLDDPISRPGLVSAELDMWCARRRGARTGARATGPRRSVCEGAGLGLARFRTVESTLGCGADHCCRRHAVAAHMLDEALPYAPWLRRRGAGGRNLHPLRVMCRRRSMASSSLRRPARSAVPEVGRRRFERRAVRPRTRLARPQRNPTSASTPAGCRCAGARQRRSGE